MTLPQTVFIWFWVSGLGRHAAIPTGEVCEGIQGGGAPDPCRASCDLHASRVSLDRACTSPTAPPIWKAIYLLPSGPRTATITLWSSPGPSQAASHAPNTRVCAPHPAPLCSAMYGSVPHHALHWMVTILTDSHC